MDRFAAEWLPEPKILHPHPYLRFDAKYLRYRLRRPVEECDGKRQWPRQGYEILNEHGRGSSLSVRKVIQNISSSLSLFVPTTARGCGSVVYTDLLQDCLETRTGPQSVGHRVDI